MTKTKDRGNNNVVALVICVSIIVCGILYVMWGDARNEKSRLESIASSKEDLYNEYIEETKNIINSKTKADQVEVAKISDEALSEIEDLAKYKQVEKGNEYLDKLKVEATKNLNNALHLLLTASSLDRNHYEEIWVFAEDETYVNKENIALFSAKREKYEHEKRLVESRKREELMSKSLVGLSESEVKLVAGSPDNTLKSTGAEFWTYGDVVLTMKNGYVYDIVYSNE
ncbi:hypothetical protein ACIQ1D_18905 [Lysinibacillus xylanilyticus]|uniref:hypothetical protein n=1 Tax=Lysinibacillus xylanilyticus TaxID=582475 RepID=UPI0038027BBB